MAGMNATMAPEVQTVFLPASPLARPITATLVRQIAGMGGDASRFVPPLVAARLNENSAALIGQPPSLSQDHGIQEELMKHLVLALTLALAALTPAARAAAAGRSAEHRLSRHQGRARSPSACGPDLAPKHVAQIKALTKRGLLQRRRLPPRHRRASWPRPATRPAPAPADRTCRTCRPSSRNEPFKRGRVGMARRTIPNSANSPVLHHASATPDSSTANTRSSARSCPAWTWSTRSRRATRPATAR